MNPYHERWEEKVRNLQRWNAPLWQPPGYAATRQRDLFAYAMLVDAHARADLAKEVKRNTGRELVDLLRHPGEAEEPAIYIGDGISPYLDGSQEEPNYSTFEYDFDGYPPFDRYTGEPSYLNSSALDAMEWLLQAFDVIYLITPDIGWIAGRTELMAWLAPMLQCIVRHYLSVDSKPVPKRECQRLEFPSQTEETKRQLQEQFAYAARKAARMKKRGLLA